MWGVGDQGTRHCHLSSSRQFYFLLVLTPIRTIFSSRGDDLSKKVWTLGFTSWLSMWLYPAKTDILCHCWFKSHPHTTSWVLTRTFQYPQSVFTAKSRDFKDIKPIPVKISMTLIPASVFALINYFLNVIRFWPDLTCARCGDHGTDLSPGSHL